MCEEGRRRGGQRGGRNECGQGKVGEEEEEAGGARNTLEVFPVRRRAKDLLDKKMKIIHVRN